ncbi:unnamed protein product [Arabidopsis thaliana]|uniref:Uncharacterized protein n=1 Tax=Arabidopsis thaliana TaxID=3702 RepID=A0A654ESM3_ARATH|nr:unnamed protein product [Arabidopsis thaliana]
MGRDLPPIQNWTAMAITVGGVRRDACRGVQLPDAWLGGVPSLNTCQHLKIRVLISTVKITLVLYFARFPM